MLLDELEEAAAIHISGEDVRKAGAECVGRDVTRRGKEVNSEFGRINRAKIAHFNEGEMITNVQHVAVGVIVNMVQHRMCIACDKGQQGTKRVGRVRLQIE